MKKIILKNLFRIMELIFVFVFAGCNTEADLIPGDDKACIQDIGFNVVLPGKSNSRAIYYTEDDASYYSVVLKKGEALISSKDGNPGETLRFTVSEEGLYSFYVSAFDDKGLLIAEGSASEEILFSSGYVLVKISLNPKIKELDVNIDIDWNKDNINYASDGIVLDGVFFSKTNEICVISKEDGNKKVIGKNETGPFVEGRQVTLSPYVMGQYEVTQELFEAVMGVNPSENIAKNELENIELRPVDYVNFYHVIAFCNKLSILQNLQPVYSVNGITDWENLEFDSIPIVSDLDWNSVIIDISKNGYRLPTEAEWEYAARGGDINSNYWNLNYSGSNNYDLVAWVSENSSMSHEVGLKNANSLGFYDMSGNSWEWCNDLYASTLEFSDSEIINPMNVVVGDGRVQKGGTYLDPSSLATVSSRRSDSSWGGPSYRSRDWGFRLCRSLTNTGSVDDTIYRDYWAKELFDIYQFYLRGSMNGWMDNSNSELTKNEDGSYSIIYTAKSESEEFKITTSDWYITYGFSESIVVGGDLVDLEVVNDGMWNPRITGQLPGNSYKMTIFPLTDTIKVKVELEHEIPQFYILDSEKGNTLIPYDGENYCYEFISSSDTVDLVLCSGNAYYTGEIEVDSKTELTKTLESDVLIISELVAGMQYQLILSIEEDVVYIEVTDWSPYYIYGEFTFYGSWEPIGSGFSPMKVTDEVGVYAYEFTYESTMSENWGEGPIDGVEFKITEGKGWEIEVFRDTVVTTEYVESGLSYGNASAPSLVDGNIYIIYLKEDNGRFFAKIEEKTDL